jgi:hypothetical protein
MRIKKKSHVLENNVLKFGRLFQRSRFSLWKYSVWISTGTLDILTDVFRGFPQSTLSTGILRRTDHYRFLMVVFHLIIYQSLYHPTLCSLLVDPDIVFNKIYPCNRPWRSIGLWDVEAPILSIQSAHRWRWGCQPYAPAALYPHEDLWYSFLLEVESIPGP